MVDFSDRKTGWAKEHEDFAFLAKPTVRAFSAPRDFVPPESMSFRDILHVEDQGNLGSCVGHGSSSAGECLEFLSNGGKVQLSRMFAYRQAQIASGIRGDNGATISGAVQAAAKVGYCLEAEWPYTGQYQNAVPNGLTQSASKHKILGHQELKSYEEIFDWISQGKGPVIFGITWRQGMSDCRGLMSVNSFSGRVVGGHCNVFAGYSGEKDSFGRFLIDGLNSWGTSWGDGGWAKWTPSAVDLLCRQESGQSSVIGITDIQGFEPERIERVVSWSEVM